MLHFLETVIWPESISGGELPAGAVVLPRNNVKMTEWPGRDAFSDGTYLTGRNNPCGTEKQDRDASDRGKVIPVVKKSKTGMHSVGRNNLCGAKEQDRDASDRGKVIPVEQKSGTGLNLVGADSVIHFDPWWNTAAENQASDRAHRIGQTKVVTVYKLVAKDTIEERILALQQQKAKLA